MSAAMKVKITATYPLASLDPDDVMIGAKANREIVARMAELGYGDVEMHVSVGSVRAKRAAASVEPASG